MNLDPYLLLYTKTNSRCYRSMYEVKKNKTFRGKYGRLFWGKQKNA